MNIDRSPESPSTVFPRVPHPHLRVPRTGTAWIRRGRSTAWLAALLLAGTALAEVPLPEASPGASVRQTVGTTEIVVTYHRPAVRGRALWGELVPWGEVWRLGANEATTLELTDAVTVAGQEVAAGRYALFAIPGPERWTMIFNRVADQWGAFGYKQGEDELRFPVTPDSGPFTEWLTFTLSPVAEDTAAVTLAWGELRLSFEVQVKVPEVVWGQIDAALATTGKEFWDANFQAAQYALDRGERLDEALAWVERTFAVEESFWNRELEARLLHRQGDLESAIEQLERALELAEGKTPQVYRDRLKADLASWRAGDG